MDSRLIVQLALITLAAFLQSVSWLSLAGVKINLVLVILLAQAFLIDDWKEYLLLVLVSVLFLRTEKLDWAMMILAGITISAYLMKKILPWQSLVSYLIFVLSATFIFYGLMDWRFIKDNPNLFLKELFYNLLFGGFLYSVLAKFHEEKIRIKL